MKETLDLILTICVVVLIITGSYHAYFSSDINLQLHGIAEILVALIFSVWVGKPNV